MNAIQFIQHGGVDKAREVVDGAPESATHYDIPFDVYLCGTKFWNGQKWSGPISNFSENDLQDRSFLNLFSLKCTIESIDLIINDFESAEMAEYEYMICGSQSEKYWIRVKQAIADHKAIYLGKNQ